VHKWPIVQGIAELLWVKWRWQYLALMRGYNSRHTEHTKAIDAVQASSQDMYDFLFPHGYRDQETGPIQKVVEEDDNSGAAGVKV